MNSIKVDSHGSIMDLRDVIYKFARCCSKSADAHSDFAGCRYESADADYNFAECYSERAGRSLTLTSTSSDFESNWIFRFENKV